MHKNDNDNWLLEMHYLQLGDQVNKVRPPQSI